MKTIRRFCSISAQIVDNSITFSSSCALSNVRASALFLRDNIQNSQCFDNRGKQRLINPLSVDLHTQLSDVKLIGDSLNVKFSDYPDEVSYPLQWIRDNCGPSIPTLPFLWGKKLFEDVEVKKYFSYEDIMNSNETLKSFYENFIKYGIAFVSDTPVSKEATVNVCERVGVIASSHFGDAWILTAQDDSFADTAYTTSALRAHNDTCYYDTPLGVQVFHCLKHDGEGGRSLFVDGFYCATKLKEHSTESFHHLSTLPVEYVYIEPGKNILKNITPVFTFCSDGKSLKRLCYNDYDRSIHQNLTSKEHFDFYSALKKLAEIVQCPSSEVFVKLTPGTVCFIDNWRVMHGRESFNGERVICGAYLTRSDYLSRAAQLGVHCLH